MVYREALHLLTFLSAMYASPGVLSVLSLGQVDSHGSGFNTSISVGLVSAFGREGTDGITSFAFCARFAFFSI